MRHTLFLMILLLSLSCTSRSQAKRDSIIDTLSDSLSDSIFPTDTLRLLFVGDLMQHQGQINAARTSTGYDYSTCFTYVKEEIKKADLSIANLEVTLGGKPYKGYPAFSAPTNMNVWGMTAFCRNLRKARKLKMKSKNYIKKQQQILSNERREHHG